MASKHINQIIVNHLKKYNAEKIGIFGSYARSEEDQESDIDILVKFKKTFSLLELIRIENELSSKLGKKVDLVTEDSIQNLKLKDYINRDLITLSDNA